VILIFLDIDECREGTDDCHSERADCLDTIGSFKCKCKLGFIGDGRTCQGMITPRQGRGIDTKNENFLYAFCFCLIMLHIILYYIKLYSII